MERNAVETHMIMMKWLVFTGVLWVYRRLLLNPYSEPRQPCHVFRDLMSCSKCEGLMFNRKQMAQVETCHKAQPNPFNVTFWHHPVTALADKQRACSVAYRNTTLSGRSRIVYRRLSGFALHFRENVNKNSDQCCFIYLFIYLLTYFLVLQKYYFNVRIRIRETLSIPD